MKRKKFFLLLIVMLGLVSMAGCGNQSASQGTTSATEAAQTQVAQTQAESQTQEKTIVSKEKVYDCDGSGHGYYHIVYSDGSTDDSEEF